MDARPQLPTADLRAAARLSANERRILAAIRRHGPLSKAAIARVTGLSAQGVSMIVRSLLADGLVRTEPKVRGQIGQPSTPIALNPSGACSIGVKIGRRSLDVATIDFVGDVVAFDSLAYDVPRPGPVMAAACGALASAVAAVGAAGRDRIAGVGIAMPGDMHLWWEEYGGRPAELAGWHATDVAAELSATSGLPVTLYNDVTAACAAEIAIGGSIRADSVIYVFIGAFIGGGIVVDGRLHVGAQGNAGALGSMPMVTTDGGGRAEQLIRRASLIFLERALADHGIDARPVIAGASDDPRAGPIFADWLARAADGLARTATAAASVIDFETMVIDGGLRADWKQELIAATRAALERYNWSGLSPISIVEGEVGSRARALGAALLPMHAQFSPDPSLLSDSRQPADEDLAGGGTRADGEAVDAAAGRDAARR